MLEEISPIRE